MQYLVDINTHHLKMMVCIMNTPSVTVLLSLQLIQCCKRAVPAYSSTYLHCANLLIEQMRRWLGGDFPYKHELCSAFLSRCTGTHLDLQLGMLAVDCDTGLAH